MLHSEEIGNKFYQHLGQLFYAIAMADRKVRPGEVAKLREDVQKYWLDLDDIKDEFGTDAAYQIEIVFDWLQNEDKSSDTHFKAFTSFYREHPEKFSDHVKKLILRTCNDIAASFAGKNKSELIVLGKLESIFREG
jgi:hypothetical protein